MDLAARGGAATAPAADPARACLGGAAFAAVMGVCERLLVSDSNKTYSMVQEVRVLAPY